MASKAKPESPACSTIRRRAFLSGLACGTSSYLFGCGSAAVAADRPVNGITVPVPRPQEDLPAYIQRTAGRFDLTLYRQLLGATNEFKEGDESLGVAAADASSREHARTLLGRTRIADLSKHAIHVDAVSRYIDAAVDGKPAKELSAWTVAELHRFLLDSDERSIKRIMPGLTSDVIACVVKLMRNDELVLVGSKIFNPLPDSQVGARGYLSARVQPNSPTDNVDDIQWQVFSGWSFAVGDALLGTNPVSSEIQSVAAIELALADLIQTFTLQDVLPHCVLAHIDIQAEVERQYADSTALWFQSLAGVEDANNTFDISVSKMVEHASTRDGKFALYFETGQGADATNGHGKGFDMVIHESRKYGFARALKQEVARAQRRAGRSVAPWVHVNDVAGFIGPEVFRTREQLVRCCLEDIVMGKLHGLTIGLDVCSTLHMEVDLDDLDWCLDQVVPAAPAYLMALPTKNDPMLSYLTTGFQDHVRIREKFGCKVSDPMWQFFQTLGVIDGDGRPTEHFGQPSWVYLQYCRRKGDERANDTILAEAKQKISEVRSRGVFVAEGYGRHPWSMEPKLDQELRHLYRDSKKCIWAELPAEFSAAIPNAVEVNSRSKDRTDYILHPPSGEQLSNASIARINRLRKSNGDAYNVQIVISDGLNALALTDQQHLTPYLENLRDKLSATGFKVSPQHIVVRSGRVRAGYRIGELLFGTVNEVESSRALVHIIGERPGSGHHAFSAYITAPSAQTWAQSGAIDHNITKVVSGIADSALAPAQAAIDTTTILQQMTA